MRIAEVRINRISLPENNNDLVETYIKSFWNKF